MCCLRICISYFGTWFWPINVPKKNLLFGPRFQSESFNDSTSLEPALLQRTLSDEFHSFSIPLQSNKESHANLSSYSVSEKGEVQTTIMLKESITNNACCTSVCFSAEQKENTEANASCSICNEKCRVSLIETHVDICLRRENN